MNTGTTLITNLPARRAAGQVRSLDGAWRAILDPYDTGLINILGERNRQGYFRDFKPRHRADRVEYDFDTSLQLQVPGDWNTQHPELLYYEGTVWYRHRFPMEADEVDGTRAFISFGSANHTCQVFLDGEELAHHVGGFGPFAVEVTGRLTAGDHSLVVMVNNRREPDRIPAMRTDWWNFGGITRSVELVTVPATFLRDAWVTMEPGGAIVGGVTVDGPRHESKASEVEIGLPGTTLAATVESAVGGETRFTLATADQATTIERWQPGQPVLHDVEFRLGHDQDTITDQVGFRTVSVDGTRILVNDEPTFLKGISLHG